MLAEWLQIEEH